MSRKVILTDTAKEKLSSLLNFLQENWSEKVKKDFVKILDYKIDSIKLNPKICPSSEKESGLHRCVLTKQNSMYYRYNSDEIVIITFFDTRQNPDKLIDDIK